MENYMMTRGWQNPTIPSQPQTNNQERKTSSQPQSSGYNVGGGYVKEVNPNGGSPVYYGATGGALTPDKIQTGGRTEWTAPANYTTVNQKSNTNNSSGGNPSDEKTNTNNNPPWMQPWAYGGPGNNFYGGNSPGGNPSYFNGLNPFMGMMNPFMGGFGGYGGMPGMGMYGGFGGMGGMFSNPFSSFGAGTGIGGGLNPYSAMYGFGNQLGNNFGGMTSDFGQGVFGIMSEDQWNQYQQNGIHTMELNPNRPKTYQEYVAQQQNLNSYLPMFGGLLNNPGLLGGFLGR